MRIRSKAIVMAAGIVAATMFLAGCGPKSAAAPGQSTTAATPATSLTTSPTPAAPPTQTVPAVTPGNCTVYTKANAVSLLGGVNFNNKALDIKTDGGTKIDECSYLDLKGTQDLQGVSYAVVRYDSAATAFAEAQKVQTEMLGSADSHNWSVQSLTTQVPGAGKVLGGYGTKTDNAIPYTIAVVGTNVGPYLVAALGASTESAANAQKFALNLFQALASATS